MNILRRFSLFAAAAGLWLAPGLHAGVVTKAASGTDLTAGASWGGTNPDSADTATWITSSLGPGLTLGAAANWGMMDVQGASGPIGISGSGTLTLYGAGGAGINLAAGGVDLSLANPVTLGAVQSWFIGSGRSLTVSGSVANGANLLTFAGAGNATLSAGFGSGAGGLTMNGAGTLTLSGSPNFTGNTAVNSGRLVLADTAATSDVSPSTAISPGGILEWSISSNRTLGAATLNFTGAGVLRKTGSASLTIGFNSGDRSHTLSLSAGGVFDVQAGDLNVGWAGSPSFGANHGGLNLVAGATLHNSQGGGMKFDWLSGAGNINNAYNSTTPTLTIGTDGTVNNAAYGVSNNTAVFSGAIGYAETYNSVSVATLNFVKAGNGTQILTGTNGWTGSTTISGGALLINSPGSLAATPVTVQSGATLGGNGTLAGTVALQSGAALAPGTPSAIGTLTLNNALTMNTGCTNFLRLAKTGGVLTNDVVKGVTGTLNYAGTLIVSNVTSDGTGLANGDTFTLFLKGSGGYGGAFGTNILPALPANLLWDTTPLASSGQIKVISGTTVTTPSFNPPAGSYIGAPSVAITTPTPGAILYYTTDGSTPTTNSPSGSSGLVVAVPANATTTLKAFAHASGYSDSPVASATYVTAVSAAWTNRAGGSWAAPGNWSNNIIANGVSAPALFNTLTLSSNVTVTLDSSPTVGRLLLGDAGNLYSWTLNPGSGGTLTLSGTNPPVLQVDNQSSTVNASLAGTAGLIKTGQGTLILGGANTLSGGLTLSQGALTANHALALGSGANMLTLGDAASGANAVNLTVGTGVAATAALAALNTTSYGTNPTITLNAGSALGQNVSDLTITTLNLNGTQPLSIKAFNSGGHSTAQDIVYRLAGSGISTGSTALVLDGTAATLRTSFPSGSAANSFTGDVVIRGAVTTQGLTYNGQVPENQNLGFLNNSVTISSNSTWTLVWGGETCGALNGPGNVAFNNQNALNSIGLTLGANGMSGSHSGVISGGFGLAKIGSGTQMLAGANTYSGATTIGAGTLLVNGVLAAGSSVTVQGSGTLGGSGTIRGPLTVQGGGVLAPGTNGIGTLGVSNSLTLAAGSLTMMELAKAGMVVTSDRVQGMSSITYGGTLLVTAAGDALAAGDKFTLFTKASGTYTGSFAALILPPLAGGLGWDTSGLMNDGSIQVMATNTVMAPTFNPPGGTYSAAQTVTIASTLGSTIYYTLDGSAPTTNSLSGPSPVTGISVGAARTLRAYASMAGLNDSAVAAATYAFLIAPDVNYYTAPGGSLAISVPGLLAACTGATTLQSLGASASGATLSRDANYIYYAAGSAGSNPDSVVYTVNDGQGRTASARIYVNFVAPASSVASAGISNGQATLNFAGLPGGAYYVQTTTNQLPTTNWWTIGMSTADANGLWSFSAAATNKMQFYRAMAAGNVSVGSWLASSSPAAPAPLAAVLDPLVGGFRALACGYTNNLLVANRAFDWSAASNAIQGTLQNGGAQWNYSTTVSNLPAADGTAVAMQWTATLVSGQAVSSGVAAAFDFANWSTNNYVLIPSSIYNGNRYHTEYNGYGGNFNAADWYDPSLPLTQSEVPRLSADPSGVSRIEILTGNAATPAMCFFSPAQQRGFIVLTEQQSRFGNLGYMIEESADRRAASFVVSAPGVRKLRPLFAGFTTSSDTGATWNAGDSLTLNFQLYSFPCADIPALLARFHEVRKNLTGPNQPRCITPASQLQGFYADRIDSLFKNINGNQYYADENADWISFGWVGGLMNTFPMLALGDATHLGRVTNTFNFAIPAAQTACGYTQYKINSDGSLNPARTSSTGAGVNLARTQGDVLFWMIKQFKLLKAQGRANVINPAWEQFARNLAVAMTNTWNLRHEFGMYLDLDTGDVALYNSTGGAMIPGGLALAADYFHEPGFMAVAQQAATLYYNRDFVAQGQCSGACGDIQENADSETTYGSMTALMALYETTGDTNWLAKARGLADLCATWTISYDYVFPPGTGFANLGVHVAGGVWASTQNKHAVAAICSSSADPLFKLYRAGQGRRYADLVRDIAACANDLTARSDRPTYGSTPGNLMERLQTGDAEGAGAIGQFMSGMNGWVVLAAMLQTLELPGIYVRLDQDEFFVFDHVNTSLVSRDASGVTLDLTNPTSLSASVTIFGENAAQAAQPLGYTAFLNWPRVNVNAGATVRVLVKPDGTLQTL
jgi:autotransporter-associated beta strand protein